jgi:hypothetical protein
LTVWAIPTELRVFLINSYEKPLPRRERVRVRVNSPLSNSLPRGQREL